LKEQSHRTSEAIEKPCRLGRSIPDPLLKEGRSVPDALYESMNFGILPDLIPKGVPWKSEEALTNLQEITKIGLDFFSRLWFQKTWVVQEVEFATVAVATCGDQSFPWADILWAFIALDALHPDTINNIDAEIQRFHNLSILKLTGSRSQPIVQLLCGSKGMEACDSRDYCFALLGLSDSAHDHTLRP
jgi:hypothetical protein